jgi:hypothetical protein
MLRPQLHHISKFFPYGRLLAVSCSCSFYAASTKDKAFWGSALGKRAWVTPATVLSVYSLQNSFPI